jgi:hypothetical protein
MLEEIASAKKRPPSLSRLIRHSCLFNEMDVTVLVIMSFVDGGKFDSPGKIILAFSADLMAGFQ